MSSHFAFRALLICWIASAPFFSSNSHADDRIESIWDVTIRKNCQANLDREVESTLSWKKHETKGTEAAFNEAERRAAVAVANFPRQFKAKLTEYVTLVDKWRVGKWKQDLLQAELNRLAEREADGPIPSDDP